MSKILIIDDERDLVALLAKKLRTNGHEVFTAYDGRAGAELAQRELPDLILDMNKVFTEDDPDDSELTFLTKLH